MIVDGSRIENDDRSDAFSVQLSEVFLQAFEVLRIDGEVFLRVHVVDVRVLHVQGDSRVSIALDDVLHVSEIRVIPTRHLKAQRPVRREDRATDQARVLLNHLFGRRTEKDEEVKDTTDGAQSQGGGRFEGVFHGIGIEKENAVHSTGGRLIGVRQLFHDQVERMRTVMIGIHFPIGSLISGEESPRLPFLNIVFQSVVIVFSEPVDVTRLQSSDDLQELIVQD